MVLPLRAIRRVKSPPIHGFMHIFVDPVTRGEKFTSMVTNPRAVWANGVERGEGGY